MSADLLGEVVTWDLEGTTVAYQDVRDALSDAGLDPDDAKELSHKSAFGRACSELKKERAIDKLKRAGDRLRFQFTRKHLADNKVDYDYECLVELDDTGHVSCLENPELEKHARELLAHAVQTRNAQDITRLVQKMFGEHADLYPINPRKGVAYFVPEQHREFTTKVERFLSHLGGRLCRFPVPKGTPQGNASVKEAVQNGLTGLLAELQQAAEEWDEHTRQGTINKAMARWEKIRYKTECYADYLGAEQDRLKAELEKVKEGLKAKYLALKPEEAKAA